MLASLLTTATRSPLRQRRSASMEIIARGRHVDPLSPVDTCGVKASQEVGLQKRRTTSNQTTGPKQTSWRRRQAQRLRWTCTSPLLTRSISNENATKSTIVALANESSHQWILKLSTAASALSSVMSMPINFVCTTQHYDTMIPEPLGGKLQRQPTSIAALPERSRDLENTFDRPLMAHLGVQLVVRTLAGTTKPTIIAIPVCRLTRAAPGQGLCITWGIAVGQCRVFRLRQWYLQGAFAPSLASQPCCDAQQ